MLKPSFSCLVINIICTLLCILLHTNTPCSGDYSFHFPNPLYDESTEEITSPENNDYYKHDNNENHEYAKISGDCDTIKSSQLSFDESRVYCNTNVCKGSTAHYDTPKLVSKLKDDDDNPVIIPAAAINHHLATNENLPSDDEEYVPPQEIIPIPTTDHHLATNANLPTDDEDYVPPQEIIKNRFTLLNGNKDEEDCQSSLATSQSAGYQELVGQRSSPAIYTSLTKFPATNFRLNSS